MIDDIVVYLTTTKYAQFLFQSREFDESVQALNIPVCVAKADSPMFRFIPKDKIKKIIFSLGRIDINIDTTRVRVEMGDGTGDELVDYTPPKKLGHGEIEFYSAWIKHKELLFFFMVHSSNEFLYGVKAMFSNGKWKFKKEAAYDDISIIPFDDERSSDLS